jgi:hypothetical protein
VRASFLASDRTYGAWRVWHDVVAESLSCGLHRIERTTRSQALRARLKRRRLPSDTGERSMEAIPSNVLDWHFVAPGPNRIWVADFTYIWTAEGWLYAAAVIDQAPPADQRLVTSSTESKDEVQACGRLCFIDCSWRPIVIAVSILIAVPVLITGPVLGAVSRLALVPILMVPTPSLFFLPIVLFTLDIFALDMFAPTLIPIVLSADRPNRSDNSYE